MTPADVVEMVLDAIDRGAERIDFPGWATALFDLPYSEANPGFTLRDRLRLIPELGSL